MKTVIYDHVMDDISENDDTTVAQCIEAAVSEVKSYLSSRYNVTAIFSAAGDSRDPLILEDTKVIAVWNLIRLSNSELIYQQWRERYDRVIDFLKQVADGSIAPELPIATDEQGNPVIKSRFGSNPKFQHNY
jgi:phage gp36-like protein